MRSKRGSTTGSRHRSVRIELDPLIWQSLQDIAASQGRSVHDLVSEIANDALKLAIHVYVAEYYREDDADNGEPDPHTSRNGS
jgi:predicted DNA-binding ribbon-helix-helix protein